MIENSYIYEKLVQAHRHELLREAQQQRMLAKLPHYTDSLTRLLVEKQDNSWSHPERA